MSSPTSTFHPTHSPSPSNASARSASTVLSYRPYESKKRTHRPGYSTGNGNSIGSIRSNWSWEGGNNDGNGSGSAGSSMKDGIGSFVRPTISVSTSSGGNGVGGPMSGNKGDYGKSLSPQGSSGSTTSTATVSSDGNVLDGHGNGANGTPTSGGLVNGLQSLQHVNGDGRAGGYSGGGAGGLGAALSTSPSTSAGSGNEASYMHTTTANGGSGNSSPAPSPSINSVVSGASSGSSSTSSDYTNGAGAVGGVMPHQTTQPVRPSPLQYSSTSTNGSSSSSSDPSQTPRPSSNSTSTNTTAPSTTTMASSRSPPISPTSSSLVFGNQYARESTPPAKVLATTNPYTTPMAPASHIGVAFQPPTPGANNSAQNSYHRAGGHPPNPGSGSGSLSPTRPSGSTYSSFSLPKPSNPNSLRPSPSISLASAFSLAPSPALSTSASQSVSRSSSPSPALSSTPSNFSQNQFQQPQQQQQTSAQKKSQTPYHPRFQPKGVCRSRTDEFESLRRKNGEGRRLEEGRLGRRVEKLIALHFPPHDGNHHHASLKSSPLASPSLDSSTHSHSRNRSSSVSSNTSTTTNTTITASNSNSASFSLGGLTNSISKSGSDVWTKTVKGLTFGKAGEGGEWEIRDAEQAIVKWQDDASVSRCNICLAHFSVRTRKHHCRLCGRVICFLPPTHNHLLPPKPAVAPASPEGENPQTPTSPPELIVRRTKCSTFITYDWNDPDSFGEGKILEVEDEDDTRNTKWPPPPEKGKEKEKENEKEKEEKEETKKVRVCRECLTAVLRRQTMTRPKRIPNYVKLHDVLMQLQNELEETFPDFQETVMSLQKADVAIPPPPNLKEFQLSALAIRKRLLSSLTSFDSVSRRIRDLPLSAGQQVGGSQDRLQRAVAHRAGLFMAEKMALLRGLGALEPSFAGGDKIEAAKGGTRKRQTKAGNVNGVASKERKASNRSSMVSLTPSETSSNVSSDVSIQGVDDDTAAKLIVLVEQEKQVAGFLQDAKSRRQFEDATALEDSLRELRAEIRRVKKGK